MKKLYSIGMNDQNTEEVYEGLIKAISLYDGEIVDTKNVAGIDLIFFKAKKRSFKKLKKLLNDANRTLTNIKGYWIITS